MTEKQMPFSLSEITAIEDVGVILTYDFTIPGTHNYVANGVLVHNTGDFEQDAHQVILIGRDLRLSGDEELDDNQPMVIKVAKNRNGGLGKIDFVFAKSRQKLMPKDIWENDKAIEAGKVDGF